MRVPEAIEPLVEQGLVDEVICPLMSGKEAQVYLVTRGSEFRIAKVYKDAATRSFKNRADYVEGRKARGSREERAMAKGSRHGKQTMEAAWRSAEVDAIYQLQTAGVRVPEPFAFVDGVLLMEFICDAEGNPAPRLGDVSLGEVAASELFHTLVREVVKMLCAGLVHGDLSEYNVLWRDDGPVIIDFPQTVVAAQNRNARELLIRDVGNLMRFLGRFAPEVLGHQYAQEMWALYERGELFPDTPLTGRFQGSNKRVNTSALLAGLREEELIGLKRNEALGLNKRKRGAAPPPARPREHDPTLDGALPPPEAPRGREPTRPPPPERRPPPRPADRPPAREAGQGDFVDDRWRPGGARPPFDARPRGGERRGDPDRAPMSDRGPARRPPVDDRRPPQGRDDRGYDDRRPPPGRDDRGYDDRRPPPGRDDRGYDDRRPPPGRDDRGYDDRRPPPGRDDRGYDDRRPPPGRDDRGYDDRRPPVREERGYEDRRPPPGRDDRGYDDRRPPPGRDDRGFDDRRPPPGRDDRGYDDRRPPTGRDDRGHDDRRPPRDERGHDDRRPPRDDRGYDDRRPPPGDRRPPPPEDRSRGGDDRRPPPQDDRRPNAFAPRRALPGERRAADRRDAIAPDDRRPPPRRDDDRPPPRRDGPRDRRPPD